VSAAARAFLSMGARTPLSLSGRNVSVRGNRCKVAAEAPILTLSNTVRR
jgi:hypothetical protein